MFQKIVISTIIFFFALFEVAVFINFFPAGAIPDLLMVAVIIWTLAVGFERALLRTIVSGAVLDLIYSWPIGINVVALTVVSFAVGFLSKRFLTPQKIWRSLFLIASVLAGTVILVTVRVFFSEVLRSYDYDIGQTVVLNFESYRSIILKILGNFLMLALIYQPLKKIDNFLSYYSHDVLNQKRTFQRR